MAADGMSTPTDTQSLHAKIRAWIQDAYQKVNGIACPWDGSEGRTLDRMLKANPSWTLGQWIAMLRNYFNSEGAYSHL